MEIDQNSIMDSLKSMGSKAGDVLSDVGDKVSDVASDAGNSLSSYIGSDDFKNLAPYLMAGGGGAVLGALLTGRRRKKSGEGRLTHLARVLGNAAIAGSLTVGGAALLRRGAKDTMGAADTAEEVAQQREQFAQTPAHNLVKNLSFSPITAGISGTAGLALTEGNRLLGNNSASKATNLTALKDMLTSRGHKMSEAQLQSLDPKSMAALASTPALDRLRRHAGLASGGGVKGKISSFMRENLDTFGQRGGARAKRLGVGLVAAGLPAVAGAFLTESEEA